MFESDVINQHRAGLRSPSQPAGCQWMTENSLGAGMLVAPETLDVF